MRRRAVGILEQWLIEGKLEPEDALTQACDLLSVWTRYCK